MKFTDIRPASMALGTFLLFALVISSGMEIVSAPSPHDDGFYVMKSLDLFGSWSYMATIKEIGSPLIFHMVRWTGIPLRIAFSVGYALSLFWLWWEFRKWALPIALCWLATLLPLFTPLQFNVFSRATSDPVAVILSICLLVSCLAVYRRRADWNSTIIASIIASLVWLNRPEGILAIISLFFTLLIVAKLPGSHSRKWQIVAMRFAAATAILGTTIIGIDTLNWIHYGMAAPTIIKAASFQHALKQLEAINDGAEHPYHPVSKHAMAMAFQYSPAMAQARTFWENNCDGKGWSTNNKLELQTDDGSIDGGHFQWALLDASMTIAGPKPMDELRYLQQVGDELKSAMDRGLIPRRSALSTSILSPRNFFKPAFWHSFWKIGKIMSGGIGSIRAPVDTGTLDQNKLFDAACSRRNALLQPNANAMLHLQGWIVMQDAQIIPDAISLLASVSEVSLLVENRPDVPSVLSGQKMDSAYCGFQLTLPADAINKTALIINENGSYVRLPVSTLNLKTGSETTRGQVRLHLDEASSPNGHTTTEKWARLNKVGKWITKLMWGASIMALLLLPLIVHRAIRGTNRDPSCEAVIIVVLIAASIILPRWLLFSVIDSTRFDGTEGRYLMPGSVLIWVLAVLVVGQAVLSLVGRNRGQKIKVATSSQAF